MQKQLYGFGFVVICFILFCTYQYFLFHDGKLHITFCNVGQGDAIFIRTPEGSDILVDGGPGDKVLDCLAKYMPFWDRSIELAVLSHPHLDHFEGFTHVVDSYEIKEFATEELSNKAEAFQNLKRKLAQKKIPVVIVFKNDKFKIKDGVTVAFISPTKDFIQKTSPNGFIGESESFASVETLIGYKDFSVLLTGDSQAEELGDALESYTSKPIDILQVPHHGSKTGLSLSILEKTKPKLAVISVGAKNRYGHPHPSTITMLEKFGLQFLRTDKSGNIEVVSGGKGFVIK